MKGCGMLTYPWAKSPKSLKVPRSDGRKSRAVAAEHANDEDHNHGQKRSVLATGDHGYAACQAVDAWFLLISVQSVYLTSKGNSQYVKVKQICGIEGPRGHDRSREN